MNTTRAISRRSVLGGSAGLLASPAIIGRAAAATRGVTDTEIVIGTMTDLSGVTAVQGVNNANAMRMAFDEVNARGGIHGRKIRWIVEDMEYIVPKAVQAMNKLLNRDNIFFALGNGGTPHNDAVMPSMFEKNVPNVFPLTCARSMYEPFNRLKFGQFASYYDQMRAGVKYFVEQRGKKVIGSMYQDTDFGKDVHAGVVAQLEAMGMKLAAETAHRADRHRFQRRGGATARCRLRSDLHGHHRQGHHDHPADRAQDGLGRRFLRPVRQLFDRGGGSAGRAGGGVLLDGAGALSLSGRSEPGGAGVSAKYRKTFGIDVNYLGEAGYTCANFIIAVAGEGRPRPDAGQFHRRDGEHEGLARHLRRPGAVAEPDQPSCVQPVLPVGGQEQALDPGDGRSR